MLQLVPIGQDQGTASRTMQIIVDSNCLLPHYAGWRKMYFTAAKEEENAKNPEVKKGPASQGKPADNTSHEKGVQGQNEKAKGDKNEKAKGSWN